MQKRRRRALTTKCSPEKLVPPSPLPTGIVTLAFTDIETSSELWERHGGVFHDALEQHNHLIRESAARWNGFEVKTAGDSFFLAFGKASDAVQWAVEAQRLLRQHEWPSEVGPVRVRIGMQTGEPRLVQDHHGAWDYFGPPVNRAARVEASGHGGQILISDATRQLAASEVPKMISFRDLGTHRLKGLGQERIWQVQHPDLERDFPPLKTLSPHHSNLPLPPSPFIGRESEIAVWRELLSQQTTHLVTLLGFGGMGKTRAALQLAELCADDFSDGVCWVELEAMTDGESMIQQIAYLLRFQIQPQPAVREQLFNFLRDRQLMLVLDNVEQIPDAAETIGKLLNAAPKVKCLVTSRRALNLQSERIVEVPPLPSNEAETLFIERARGRAADLVVTEESSRDIAELCRRLEGVPLAIELAATRIIAMTPREMLRRVGKRFSLLQSRSPDLPPRQRAMRATMDWSYELLSDEDRKLFAQLSVFEDGFNLDAAETICDALDVLEGVTELRRHSLLRAETEATTQQRRFHMLEALRDYAREKLQSYENLADQVARRHAEYFLTLAEQCSAQERTSTEAMALKTTERELGNLRAAVQWTHEHSKIDTAQVEGDVPQTAVVAEWCARLAIALSGFLDLRGLWQTGLEFINLGLEVLDRAGQSLPRLRAQLLYSRASLEYNLDEFQTARQHANDSLEACRLLNDEANIARALNLLGLCALREGKLEEAESHLEESLRWQRLLNAPARVAICLNNLGILASDRDDYELRQELQEEALVLVKKAGDQRGLAEAEGNLGVLAFKRGEVQRARTHYESALRLNSELDNKLNIARQLFNLGEVLVREGNADRAVQFFSAARRLFSDIGSPFIAATDEALQQMRREPVEVNANEVVRSALAGTEGTVNGQ